MRHGDLPRYTTTHLPGGGVTYTKVAAGAELAGEAVAAMAADSQPTLSCKSLSPSATDYWCVTACAGRNNCPRNICKCDEGFRTPQSCRGGGDCTCSRQRCASDCLTCVVGSTRYSKEKYDSCIVSRAMPLLRITYLLPLTTTYYH